VVAFGGEGDGWRISVERFTDSSVRDRRAAALAAAGMAVLVCEVLVVLRGGDEGLPEPPRPQKRR
jgi:hypothetical protein